MYHFRGSGPHFSTKMHHITAPYTFFLESSNRCPYLC